MHVGWSTIQDDKSGGEDNGGILSGGRGRQCAIGVRMKLWTPRIGASLTTGPSLFAIVAAIGMLTATEAPMSHALARAHQRESTSSFQGCLKQ